MDFLDSLKEIKSQMSSNSVATSPNKNEPKNDDFSSETAEQKESRLKDEFMEFVKFADVKKLD